MGVWGYYTKEQLVADMKEYILELAFKKDPLSVAKLKALQELMNTPRVTYDDDNNGIKLYVIILKGKLEQIKKAESKQNLKEILAPPKLRYDGNKLAPENKWVLPEEELLMWSKASLCVPLSQEGFERYMEVFKQVFPDKFNELLA